MPSETYTRQKRKTKLCVLEYGHGRVDVDRPSLLSQYNRRELEALDPRSPVATNRRNTTCIWAEPGNIQNGAETSLLYFLFRS
jgi:hypothetical protein